MLQTDLQLADSKECVSILQCAPWRVWLMLSGIVLIAAGLRLYRISDVNYWFDETFSIRLSQFSTGELIARSALDTHPPLFFILLKGWTGIFGTTLWTTRLLSTCFSVCVVTLAFMFVYEVLTRHNLTARSRQYPELGACLAAMLIALSPLQITWAHQVRMYAPVACLTTLSTWLLWRAVTDPSHPWKWLAYGAAELAGLYTHVTMTFVCCAHFVFLAGVLLRSAADSPSETRASLRRGGLLTVLGIGLLFAPWLLRMQPQFSRVQQGFWTKPLDSEWLSNALSRCFTVSEALVIDASWGLWIGQFLFVILILLALGRRHADLLVAITAALPFMGLIAVSLLGRNIVTERYFISGSTLAMISISLLVARIRWSTLRLPLACGLIALEAMLTWSYFQWREQASNAPGIPGLIQTWQELRAPREPLIFSTPMFYVTARVEAGDEPPFWVFGTIDRYPFFVGTAVLVDSDCISAAQIDVQEWESIWTCNFVGREEFLPPIELSNNWTLAAEQNIKEFNCELMLRRFQRRNLQIQSSKQ